MFSIIYVILISILYTYYIYQIGTFEKGIKKMIVLVLINLSFGICLTLFKFMIPALFIISATCLLYDLFYDDIPIKVQWFKVLSFGLLTIIIECINYFFYIFFYTESLIIICLFMYLIINYTRKSLHWYNIVITFSIFGLILFTSICYKESALKFILMLIVYLGYFLIDLSYQKLSHDFSKNTQYFQQNLVHSQYEEIKNIYLNMRGWRHDYHTHIQTVKAYIQLNQINEANNYLQELEEDLTKVDTYVKSGNLMVDAILNSKLSLAETKNIKINCKANAPNKLSISDVDLCVILGNLLDNAIEACEKIDENKRFIRVYINVIKCQLYISIQNSAKQELNFNEKNYITTKRGNHGLGMKRVKLLVDKYEGYLNLQNEPGIFASEVSIPISIEIC